MYFCTLIFGQVMNAICRNLGLVVGLLLVLMQAGCLKDDATVILPTPLDAIPSSILSAEQVDSLRSHMAINLGADPPLMVGQFKASPMQLAYASDRYYNVNIFDVFFECDSQNCRNLISYREWQSTARLRCVESCINGTGDRFTVAGLAEMSDSTVGWRCTLALIVSGRKVDGGITDLEYATLMKQKEDPTDLLLDVNTFRIYRDGDGLVEATSWTGEPPIAPASTLRHGMKEQQRRGGSR